MPPQSKLQHRNPFPARMASPSFDVATGWIITLPDTNKAPLNQCLEDEITFGDGPFSGILFVSGRVFHNLVKHQENDRQYTKLSSLLANNRMAKYDQQPIQFIVLPQNLLPQKISCKKKHAHTHTKTHLNMLLVILHQPGIPPRELCSKKWLNSFP